jgi:UrcA family protein
MKTTISKNLRAAIHCAIAGATLGTLLCTAAPADEPLASRTVTYADLDISQMAGAQVLYRRIEMAALHVCPLADLRNLSARPAHDRCVKQAIDNAVNGVHSAILSSLHASRALRLASN